MVDRGDLRGFWVVVFTVEKIFQLLKIYFRSQQEGGPEGEADQGLTPVVTDAADFSIAGVKLAR
jgi:hypothetical protein